MAEPLRNGFSRTNHDATLLTMQTLFAWVTDSCTFLAALTARQVFPPELSSV